MAALVCRKSCCVNVVVSGRTIKIVSAVERDTINDKAVSVAERARCDQGIDRPPRRRHDRAPCSACNAGGAIHTTRLSSAVEEVT